MIYLILAAVHIILCLFVLLGIIFRILKVHKYMFFVALLLPIWGILIILILHFKIAFDPDASAMIDVEKMRLDSELYKSVVIDEKKTDSTIPIEEALIINSAKERRSLIMDVLNDNPVEYVEMLQRAGNNEDTEVVHYAVTAMVEISKENDYTLQQLERAYSETPEDIENLTKYSDFLWECLSQNLMKGQVELMNRELFSQLMHKKLLVSDSLTDYSRLAENELKCKRYDSAGEIISEMEKKWPDSEEYILLKIHHLSLLNKGDEIKSFVKQTQNSNVYLSPKAKEALAFWTN